MSTLELDDVDAARRRSLQLANHARQERARLRHELHAGRLQLVDALEHPHAGGVTVYTLLCWLPRVGESTATRWLRELQLRENKPVGTLTARQRQTITAHVAAVRPDLERHP